MAKLTAEQQRQLADLQALADAPDDDEFDLVVRDEKGRETRLTGKHAQKWLKNLGLGDDDEPEGDKAADDDKPEDDEPEGDKTPANKAPRWFR